MVVAAVRAEDHSLAWVTVFLHALSSSARADLWNDLEKVILLGLRIA